MVIPVNLPILGTEEIKAVNNVLRSGLLTSAAKNGGKYVQEFEKHSSSFTKSRFSIAVNSGTAALQAALLSLDVKKGDEVLLPSFTFVATANAVLSVGAKPVFVDITSKNHTMDPQDLQKKITKKSKIVIPVHLYGNVAFMDEIIRISKKNNLRIIEDAAQSLGSTYKKKHTGTFGDLGCYSLYPAKVMTAGEGGFITTNNKKLYEKLLLIRNHGTTGKYDTKTFGLNLRMPEINAAIAIQQIKKLGKFLAQRKKNAKHLSDLLSGTNIQTPTERTHEKVNWYLYTITTKKRDILQKKLNQKGFGAVAYYPVPIHQSPFYKTKTRLYNTEWAAKHVLSLPVQPNVTITNLDNMAKIIRNVTRS